MIITESDLIELSKTNVRQDYADTLVFNGKNQLLILKRRDDDDFMPSMWCLPGGKIEEGETRYNAAKRELWEETSILLDDNLTYLDWNTSFINDNNSKTHYFAAKYDVDFTMICLDITEHDEFAWINIKELGNYNFMFDLDERIKKNIKSIDSTENLLSSTFKHFEPQEVIEDINKAFDSDELSFENFVFCKGKFGDASHGGKLIKVKQTDKNGKQITKWVKNKKDDEKQNFDNLSDNELKEHAKNASEQSLNSTIKNHVNPKIREHAHNELSRRKKEEYKQEPVKEDSIDDLKTQYKDAMESNDFDKLMEISKKLAENSAKYQKEKLPQFNDNLGKHLTQNFSDEDKDNLDKYVSIKYKEINGQLREDKLSTENKKIVSVIDKVMKKNKLSQDTIVYRGFDSSDVKNQNAFSSTSLDESVAKNFSRGKNPTIKKYVIPKGTPCAYIGGKEYELLLPRNFDLQKFEQK
jgi:8-oxo-dGTP pyrophosphatase MutT (NUDIX family)